MLTIRNLFVNKRRIDYSKKVQKERVQLAVIPNEADTTTVFRLC